MTEPIRVFVSYSGDDWESFVKPFATELLRHGIHAVVADWDIHGGESLVKRIFEEEIPRAQAIVIVLSPTSVTKPWVLEELDLATVRRIEEDVRLIPVKIGDCDIPHSLRATKRISYHVGDSFEDRTKDVVDSIYGVSQKPPIGDPPTYTRRNQLIFPELSSAEANVLDILLRDCLETGYFDIDVHRNLTYFEGLGLSHDLIDRTVAKLKARGYLEERRIGSVGMHISTQISVNVAADYCREHYSMFDDLQVEVVARLASLPSGSQLVDPFPDKVPDFVYRSAVEELRRDGIVSPMWTWGRTVYITPATPFLDEWLEEHQ